jgi:hypothetical protein
MKTTILLFLAFLLLRGCPDKTGQEFIYIMNKSDRAIAFQPFENKQVETFHCVDGIGILFYSVNSNATLELYKGYRNSGWETFLKTPQLFRLSPFQCLST